MAIVLTLFIILILYDLPRFIKNKEPVKLYIIYLLLMTASFIISLLLTMGKRPPSPAQIIQEILQGIGVIS